MKNTVDLHCHTYYSDGRPSPQEMIERAAEIGLQVVAITDHDTSRGSREAAYAAAQFGIELIPAIEFVSHWDAMTEDAGEKVVNQDIDVLGYFLDLENPELQAFETAAMDDLYDRIGECAGFLTAQGFPVCLEDVLRVNPRYGGVLQLIEAVMKKGMVPEWDEGVRLVVGEWERVRQGRFGICEVIKMIHKAGGAAVLAHPSLVQTTNGWLKARHIASLVDFGLDGLEIYHYRLNTEARQHFLGLAQQFGLAVSGGSDEHGWPEGFPRLGSQTVTVDMVTELKRRAGN